jgi:hypothetical protein
VRTQSGRSLWLGSLITTAPHDGGSRHKRRYRAVTRPIESDSIPRLDDRGESPGTTQGSVVLFTLSPEPRVVAPSAIPILS